MLVVDGTFEDQIDELATYIDSLTEGESKVQETVQEKLAQGDTESAIKVVVDSSDALLSANEKGSIAILQQRLKCSLYRFRIYSQSSHTHTSCFARAQCLLTNHTFEFSKSTLLHEWCNDILHDHQYIVQCLGTAVSSTYIPGPP